MVQNYNIFFINFYLTCISREKLEVLTWNSAHQWSSHSSDVFLNCIDLIEIIQYLYNKLIIYKVIINPSWAYRIQLFGAACNSNLDINQRFHSKTLRLMLYARWYVTNAAIHKALEIETVKKEIERYSEHYKEWLRTHPNELAINLLNWNLVVRRLKSFKPLDLHDRFK